MVGERLRLVPQRMANDPGCGSRASDPQGTSEEGRQARLTRPSKIHFHLIWRSNLSQTIAFALLLGGILLITHFRNGTSEIVLPKLIERLMRIAVEHAGAERGLLILLRGDEPQLEAV